MMLVSISRRTLLGLLLWTALGIAIPLAAAAICGDGVLDVGETCDDSNTRDGDCCSSICQLEPAGSLCDVDACNADGTCDAAGACLGASPIVCDDELFCNGAETCDPALGCQAGTPPPTDDGVACTDDGCDEEADVITHVPDHDYCDDGLLCTGDEICDIASGCEPGPPVAGSLAPGDIVVADPRVAQPNLGALIVKIDPVSGAQTPLSIGGLMTAPFDVGIEANRCLIVPDTNTHRVLRIDPPAFDPQNPGANQRILAQNGNLGNPRGVAIDADGTIYVADFSTADQVHRIDPVTGAQSVVAREGHLYRPRHLAVDRSGLLYVPVYNGSSPDRPGIVRIDPDAYDPNDKFANQEIVASGGYFVFTNGPWDVDFDLAGNLYVVNAQNWNVIRVDVDAYDPNDEFANQELVADDGNFVQIRGLTVEADGKVIVINENDPPEAIRVDPDAFDPANQPANQTVLAWGLPMVEPRGADVVRDLPEPGMGLLLVTGALSLAGLARRRGRRD